MIKVDHLGVVENKGKETVEMCPEREDSKNIKNY